MISKIVIAAVIASAVSQKLGSFSSASQLPHHCDLESRHALTLCANLLKRLSKHSSYGYLSKPSLERKANQSDLAYIVLVSRRIRSAHMWYSLVLTKISQGLLPKA